MKSTAEGRRLAAADDRGVHWRRWGPYLSDRQWGTVREDYSDTGDAWSYFTHDQARSRAYRWGEDGIAGVSDDQQVLCLSLGLWNGADPILKERFFGLTNAEGNHGEDVKEYYFHLDSTPTHSYMRMLYKYPQAAYPYENLVATNRERSRTEFEYELLDTGVFAGDRYFDVEVEWAKADPEDLAALVTVTNRGPADAPLDVLANIWFRNTWAPEPTAELPVLAADGPGRIVATHARQWFHMQNGHILSMPDCWEYPWYAAWDLAFHCVPLSMVDPGFTRGQIELMLSDVYLHPSGQIPAYEWNFGDVNPPVHAWATLFAFAAGAGERTERHTDFLRDAFKKLLLNFSWWLNRKDPAGRNLFEGGFLGLDNIGVFDRSAPLPTGGHLEQADGTAWMALFSQNMLDLALILSVVDPSYEDLALKFVQHFFWIAAAMDKVGQSEDEMWDEQDGFYYDVLRLPDGSATRLRVRSMVGLIPLCAVSIIPAEVIERFPSLAARARENYERYADLLGGAANPLVPGWRDGACCRSWTSRSCAGCCLACLTRPAFSARTGFGRCPAATWPSPSSSPCTGSSTGCSICLPSLTPACSAATPTGAVRCGSPSTSSSSGLSCTITSTTAMTSPSSAPPVRDTR